VVDSETGRPYESEIEMLRKVLDRIELERDKAFVADRGYDAVDIIQKILNKGLKSAIKVKETVRMRIGSVEAVLKNLQVLLAITKIKKRRSLAHASKMLFKYLKELQGDDQGGFVFLWSSLSKIISRPPLRHYF